MKVVVTLFDTSDPVADFIRAMKTIGPNLKLAGMYAEMVAAAPERQIVIDIRDPHDFDEPKGEVFGQCVISLT